MQVQTPTWLLANGTLDYHSNSVSCYSSLTWEKSRTWGVVKEIKMVGAHPGSSKKTPCLTFT